MIGAVNVLSNKRPSKQFVQDVSCVPASSYVYGRSLVGTQSVWPAVSDAELTTHSIGVFQCEPDLEDLCIELLDLSSEIEQLLVLLLSAGWVFFLAVVSQLVDLQRVIKVLGVLSLLFEALDSGCADGRAIGGHALLN